MTPKRLGLADITADDALKFMAYVEVGGPDKCWRWTGGTHPKSGYGRWNLYHDGRQGGYQAHQVALFITTGPAPDGKPFACHSCDNPPCCNPQHLFWGSNSDNQQDAVSKGRHAYGERHPNHKLTTEQALFIQQSSLSPKVLGKMFGISGPTATLIKNGKRWKHLYSQSEVRYEGNHIN